MTVRCKVLHQVTTNTCILLLALILTINFEAPVAGVRGVGAAASAPVATTASTSNIILSQYQLQNDSYFTHLVYDKKRSCLYAGATNRIIQLTKNLTVINSSVTGPKPDSPVCHAGGCPDDVETMETNNFNKLLILNKFGDALISCGSLHQGACEIYENLNTFPLAPKYIELPVVANDENSSSYAFIGPSRYTAWQREDILYVGTTFTNVGDYRDNVPAIASRKLDDLNYAEFSIQQSNINIDVKYRDHFLVNYIYGFNSTDYAYFVIVQKKNHLVEEAGYHTRLARICVTDPNYDSYTEVTLSCVVKSQDYNIMRDAKLTEAGGRLAQKLGIRRDDQVLVATFSPSKEITAEPQNSSAICVYTLKDIEEMFNENIHMCFNGTIKDRNLGYISGSILDGKCPLVGSIGNIHDFCHAGLKISGVAAITANAVFSFENELVTSVITTITGPHIIAFLGTAEGNIKKVILSEPSVGEYDRVAVDPENAILPDTMVSPEQDVLYVLSRKKITKMKIENCASHTTCSSCLGSNDLMCGWCSLEKRCTVRSACQRDTSASRWLSIGAGQQCIDFETADPDRVPIDQMTTINLVIKTLPELPANAKYKCVFGNSTPIDAAVTTNGLICQTPQVKYRPPIEFGKDHVLVPLSVRSSETNKDFVSRSFAFFDCSVHESCFKCLKSQWNCNWCIYDNKCVFENSTCRNTANTITVENQCPRIKAPKNEILLPNKVPKEIKLEIINLPRPQSAHSGFLCIVNIEGAHMILPARIEANKYIVCDKTPYSYEANTNEYKAKVDVTWNRNHYVDTISITLYKCDVLGSHKEHADCSLCVTRDPKYQCTWCGNECVFNDTCLHGSSAECPRPRIDSIRPLSGPIEGGTLVTIEGSNLGIREDDVRGKIRIGNVLCELVNYEISVKIECRTGAVDKEMTATVRVGNEAGVTESNVYFQYKDFRVERIAPTQGPQSGGTQVQIFGRHLNIGSSVIAYLDDYICHINATHATDDRLVCTTTASRSPEFIRTLTLIVDLANRTLQCKSAGKGHNSNDIGAVTSYGGGGGGVGGGGNSVGGGGGMRHGACSIYNYTVDPKIMQIKPLKSFKSGGRMITVHGTNLHTIQRPQMEVIFGDESINRTDCTVINPNQMECPSPAVSDKFRSYFIAQKSRARRDVVTRSDLQPRESSPTASPPSPPYMTPSVAYAIQETQLNFQISFVMDSVKSVRDLNKHFQHIRSNMIYVDDPLFFPFLNSIRLYKGDTLVIEGENLNLACDESDVSVTVGQQHCNVTSLALAQLVCTPPAQQPASTDEFGRENDIDLPLVVVRVGQRLRFPLGYLKYDLLKPYAFSQAMIVIAASTFVLALVLVFILIVYRRKTTQAEREYKKIQIQMDTLESNVRLECKQAFAELQTDIIDLTADLENQGIPTLDHVNYIMKVFFPGVSDHPILNGHKGRMNMLRTNYDAAMLQFEQLINNKFFLLTFIETLEAQRTFNIRDKVNVASLLMIVLMNKMEYATDVLKWLLLRLVDKSVLTKHPHLMLRRTESVVEKMLTNYMAICMYNYLREYSGSSLFLLFRAIKHQVEKGLVDAITHEARYSLAEDRLLREQIDTSVVTLHILQDDLEEKVQCKVLDQDTITQVKAKILDALFKNTPFSMRPSVHDVDLEWRHGRGGHLTLQDEDLTTKTLNGWKRLNTLAHYGVKESAVMSLVARQHDSYSINAYSGKNMYPNCYYINNTQTHVLINGVLDSTGVHNHNHHPQLINQAQTLTSGSHKQQYCRVHHLVKTNMDEHYFGSTTFNGKHQSHHPFLPPSNNCATVERTHKAIPEIYLTRLLATKGTIQKFVDDFFMTILTVNEKLPPAVKWLFDLLDDAARRHPETNDPKIIHAWKSNSLPLRFWVNFIKNPDFIFDINKTVTVDACLSVVAQTFMDACSTNEHRLGKDSPSNKLLFAKDLPHYREMVSQFYADVARLPQISDQEMTASMQNLSVQQNDEFDTIAALKELYIYVTTYKEQIIDALEMDINCKKLHLANKLENVGVTLDGIDDC